MNREGSRQESSNEAGRIPRGSGSPDNNSPENVARSYLADPSGFIADNQMRGSNRRGMRRQPAYRETQEDEGDAGRKATDPPVFKTEGTEGTPIDLITNYYQVLKDPQWSLFKNRVDFIPDQDDTYIRKALLKGHREMFGPYIFDGTILFTSRLVPGANVDGITNLTIKKKDDTVVNIILKDLGRADYGDPVYTQFYNLMVRKCLYGLGLEDMGRGFYDQRMAVSFPHLRVELWPGYMTSMGNHDRGVLLCVEVTHKVIRTENVLNVINGMMSSSRPNYNSQEAITNSLKDSIVMTVYNNTTYRIQCVDFNSTPLSTFSNRKGEEITFLEYYKKKSIEIKSTSQPLLIAKKMKRDRKYEGDDDDMVKLVPELCQMTGLTEAMRNNFGIMKELAKHLHMTPIDRIEALTKFMDGLQGVESLMQELADWGFVFDTHLVACTGRVLSKTNILFANGVQTPNDNADWTPAFRSQQLLNPTSLLNWIIISTKRDVDGIDNLIRTMQKVASPLGFSIDRPKEVILLPDPKTQTFGKAIDNIFHSKKHKDAQLYFVVLPNNSSELYGAIKKRLVVDYGVSSQCFLSKNMRSKGLMSIVTKMTVQMCTKIGGEPWSVKIPLKGLMIIGFDSYKRRGSDIGAMVASISPDFTKYFSTISYSSTHQEQTKNIADDFIKCISCFKDNNNGALPERIVVYRVGGNEAGTIAESKELLEILKRIYKDSDMDMDKEPKPPKFTYIVVSKKINTRIMTDLGKDGYGNPPPGTILDHTITLPNRYEFFLVSSTARQGTVSPCSYNVLWDSSGLTADKMQALTYKLCHLYFNWSGTVAIPAPCQYASKLAKLTAMAYDRPAHSNLSELLYYL